MLLKVELKDIRNKVDSRRPPIRSADDKVRRRPQVRDVARPDVVETVRAVIHPRPENLFESLRVVVEGRMLPMSSADIVQSVERVDRSSASTYVDAGGHLGGVATATLLNVRHIDSCESVSRFHNYPCLFNTYYLNVPVVIPISYHIISINVCTYLTRKGYAKVMHTS